MVVENKETEIENKDIQVLFWLTQFPVVSETFIRDQIIGLADAGVGVHIYCQKFNRELVPTIPDFEYHEWLNSIFEDQSALVGKGGKMIAFLRVVCRLFLHKKIRKRQFLKQLWKNKGKQKELRKLFLLEFIVEQKINVIHAHFGPNGNETCLLHDWGLPIRLITTFHGYDIRLGMEQKGLYESLFAKAYRIVSISKFNTEKLLSFGVPRSKLIHIPNGVDMQLFHGNRVKGDTSSIRFLSVARLVEDKALHIAILGLESYHLEHPEVAFVFDIIGEGYLREELAELIKDLQIKDRIRFELICFVGTIEIYEALLESPSTAAIRNKRFSLKTMINIIFLSCPSSLHLNRLI